jgi:hypothetical protein
MVVICDQMIQPDCEYVFIDYLISYLSRLGFICFLNVNYFTIFDRKNSNFLAGRGEHCLFLPNNFFLLPACAESIEGSMASIDAIIEIGATNQFSFNFSLCH